MTTVREKVKEICPTAPQYAIDIVARYYELRGNDYIDLGSYLQDDVGALIDFVTTLEVHVTIKVEGEPWLSTTAGPVP